MVILRRDIKYINFKDYSYNKDMVLPTYSPQLVAYKQQPQSQIQRHHHHHNNNNNSV
jgi:hypothetical protein